MSLNMQKLLAVVSAHKNSEVVGRRRLQETVCLLKRLGYPVDYDYTPLFYGPYREDLQVEVGMLESHGLVQETAPAGNAGASYVVRVLEKGKEFADVESLRPFKTQLDLMASADTTVLELAATYATFLECGYTHEHAIEATRAKKGSKASDGNLERALSLLRELGLLKEMGDCQPRPLRRVVLYTLCLSLLPAGGHVRSQTEGLRRGPGNPVGGIEGAAGRQGDRRRVV